MKSWIDPNYKPKVWEGTLEEFLSALEAEDAEENSEWPLYKRPPS